MGCNCKNKIEFEKKYGTKVEVGVIGRSLNFLLRIFVFLIVAVIAVIVTPIVLVSAIYQMFFGKDKGITIPKGLIETIKGF